MYKERERERERLLVLIVRRERERERERTMARNMMMLMMALCVMMGVIGVTHAMEIDTDKYETSTVTDLSKFDMVTNESTEKDSNGCTQVWYKFL